MHVNFCKPRAKTRRQVSFPCISCRIHGSKDAEIGMPKDPFDVASLGKQNRGRPFTAMVEETGYVLECIRRSQVDFIEKNPFAISQCSNYLTLNKGKSKFGIPLRYLGFEVSKLRGKSLPSLSQKLVLRRIQSSLLAGLLLIATRGTVGIEYTVS